MYSAVEVSKFSELKKIFSDAGNNPGKELYVIVKNNISVNTSGYLNLSHGGMITLVAEGNVKIDRCSINYPSSTVIIEVSQHSFLFLGNSGMAGTLTITGNNKPNSQSLISVNNFGCMEMNNGVTIRDSRGTHGGGVSVESDGCFIMNGGIITGNKADMGGGVYIGGGSFYKSGGSITKNEATQGGGVHVTEFLGIPGYFSMDDGGSITGNKAEQGGGVYITGAESGLVMVGGSISGNTATAENAGGGVFVVDRGVLEIYGGSISGNLVVGSSSNYGGGVFVDEGGNFNMSGGNISNNIIKALSNAQGGGVRVNPGGTFNMSGGKITKNEARDSGGVDVAGKNDNVATFIMRNNAEISGNKGWGVIIYSENGAEVYANFEMHDNALITNNDKGIFVVNSHFFMSGGTVNCKAGNIVLQKNNGITQYGTTNAMADIPMTSSDIRTAPIIVKDGVLMEQNATHFAAGNEGSLISAINTIMESGNNENYVINFCDDIEFYPINFSDRIGIDVTINGNGQNLSFMSTASPGAFLSISNSQSVTINDLTLIGRADNNSALVTINGGTLHIYETTISGNTNGTSDGGGVRVDGGTFNMMSNSKISGNTAANGGGVYVGVGGTLAIYNGIIYGNDHGNSLLHNNVTDNGAALYVYDINSAKFRNNFSNLVPIFSDPALSTNETITVFNGVCTFGDD